MAGKAKLWEFDEKYSTGDVFTLLELLDIESAIEQQRAKDDETKRKRDNARNR